MSEPEKPNTKTECYGCEKLTERVDQLQDENKRLTNDLKDALGIKAGEGPTALSMVVDENKQLRDLLRKGLHAVKPEEIQEFWTRARKLLNL